MKTLSSPRNPSFLAAAVVLGLVPIASARADIVVVKPADVTVNEGSPDFTLTFKVTNTFNVPYILDFALATITPQGPDKSDTITFSGFDANGLADGHNGLVAAPTLLYGAADPRGTNVGLFTYSFNTGKAEVGNDFGRNLVAFSIEMSPYGGPIPPPFPLQVPAAVGNLYIYESRTNPSPDPAILAGLLAFQNSDPTKPGRLYPGGVFGRPDPAITTVTVLDVPEPASIALTCLGGSLLYGLYRRRSSRSPRPAP